MKNPVDSFAAALRAARAKRHLTQRALADNLHMSVRTIIEIELGRSNLSPPVKRWQKQDRRLFPCRNKARGARLRSGF